MHPIVPPILVTASLAALITATVSGIVAQAAPGARTAESVARTLPLPQEVLPGQTVNLVVDSPVEEDEDSVLAWHGQGRSAQLRRFDDRGAAFETNDLTVFDAYAARNGFTKFVGRDGRCLALVPSGPRLTAALDSLRCNAPNANWSVEGGRLVASSGPTFVGTTELSGALLAVDDVDDAAHTGITLQYQGTTPAVSAEVTVPDRFDQGPQLTGTTRPSSDVTVADVYGRVLLSIGSDADGSFSAVLPAGKAGTTSSELLISVVERGADRLAERSWVNVPYSAGVQVGSSVVVDDGSGRVVLNGTGDVGASVRVIGGGTGAPTTVGRDGRWSIPVELDRSEKAFQPVRVSHVGFGAFTTEQTVSVRASGSLNATAVFPADDAEQAFVEGTAQGADRVEVTSSGGAVVGADDVDRETGYYRVAIPAPNAGGVTTVHVTEQDEAGTALRSGDVDFDWGNPVEITAPAADGEFSGSRRATGFGEPGAEVSLQYDGADVHTIVGPAGRWSASLSEPATTRFGLTSDADLVASSSGTPALTGTGRPGATVGFVPDGERRAPREASTTVRADGTWRIPGASLGGGFSGTDVPDAVVGTVQQDPGTPGAAAAAVRIRPDLRAFQVLSPSADGTIRTDDGIVRCHGTGTPGSEVLIRDAQDRLRSTVVLADGTWESGELPVAVGATTARFVGTGPDGVVSVDVSFSVESTSERQHTVTTPAAGTTVEPVVSDKPWEPDSIRFSGTAPAGARISVLDEAKGGREVATTTRDDGTWSVLSTGFGAGPASVLVQQIGDGVPVRVPFTVAAESGSQVVVTSPQPGSTVELVANETPFKDWVEVTGTAKASAAVSVYNRKIPNADTIVTAGTDGRWRALVRAVPGAQEFRIEAAGSVPVTVEFTATE
ncbi:hypothetical protein SAMN02800687_1453 [Curtobacterium sp. UNCCL20]|uniref:hypothetical protein n=1 Tax=Curtobacterium sp. UNCCL20 TaxID=1502773 RepID=UPI00088A0A2B|nr:hypothetical protein [Curtobacterium sp. UNCCL20]SDQ33345.1 hypothetical protein SAMN02800687_1453 [Curtobacterium sp. UNCCL20]